MGGPENVTDKRPIVRRHGRPQRGEPRSHGGRRRSPWENGGRLPQQRQPIRRRDRGNPSLRCGGARADGGGPGRRGTTPATSRRRRSRRKGRLRPLTTVGVARQPQARRQRRAGGDGRPGARQSRRRRCFRRRHSPRRGVSSRRARQACDGRDLGAVGARSHRGRGGRSPAGAIVGRRRGRLHLSRSGCRTRGPRRRQWHGRQSTRGAADARGRRRVKREESGWMRCFTRDRSEARGQQPLTPRVCPSLNVLEAPPRQRSDRAHKSQRPSRSPQESPRAQLQNELPSRYRYK